MKAAFVGILCLPVLGCFPGKEDVGNVGSATVASGSEARRPSADAKGGVLQRGNEATGPVRKDLKRDDGVGDAGLRDSLIGVWWGSENDSEVGDENETQQINWLVERRRDGTFRNKIALVDHARKVYCIQWDLAGTWRVQHGDLIYTKKGSGAESVIHFKKDHGSIVWGETADDGFEASTRSNVEKKRPDNSFPFESYTELTKEEFSDRTSRDANRRAEE